MFGWIFAGSSVGRSCYGGCSGISRDTLATYLPAFFVAGAICILVAASMLIRSAHETRQQEAWPEERGSGWRPRSKAHVSNIQSRLTGSPPKT